MKKGLIPGIAVGAAAAIGLSVLTLFAFKDEGHKHKYTSSVAEEATCAHNGVIVYTCEECGETVEELIAPKEHTFVKGETVEPTYDNGGYTIYRCTGCGKEYKDDFTDPLEKIIDNANVTLKNGAFEYTGSPITIDTSDKDAVKVFFKEDEVLTLGTDYELSYADNVNVGDAKLTVTAKGNAKGSKTVNFVIYPKAIEITKIDTGNGIHAEWEAVHGADGYELIYSKDPEFKDDINTFDITDPSKTSAELDDKPEAGMRYYVKIRAYKLYNGEIKGVYGSAKEIIVTAGIGELTLDKTEMVYAGKALTPAATLKDKQGKVLTLGTDYTIAYANNVEPGTATVTATGTGVYAGTKTVNFTIRPAGVNDIEFVGLSDVYLYSGKNVEPSPTLVVGALKLERGKDYDITYANNTGVGTGATMTFTFKGRFSGTVTKTFNIENTGWETVGGETFFVENGTRYTKEGMRSIDGDTYYFSSTGAVQTGWIKIGEDYYCFDRLNGKMYAACEIDGINVDASGRAITSSYSINKITTMMTAHKIMLEQTLPTDTMEEKRLKCFNWVLSFPYKQWRLLKNIYDSSVDWEFTFANDIFRKGSGCCVAEASATAFLFREIGYTEVYICHDSGHSWVMVGDKLFDPVFAEAKDFGRNYNIEPYDYRKWPLRKRRVDGKAYDGAPS